MKRLGRLWLAIMASSLALSGMALAQVPNFDFSFAPDEDMVTGVANEELTFTGKVVLTTSDNPTAGSDDERGAQGWQVSVGLEKLPGASGGLVEATKINLTGTDANDLLNTPIPPDIDPFSVVRFVRNEVVDRTVIANPDGTALGGESEIPVGEPQGPGFVSAVVLPFAEGFSVEAGVEGSITITNLEFIALAPQTEGTCDDVRVFFIDGKKGSGQPIKNTVTFKGDSIPPSRQEAVVEACSVGAIFDLELAVDGNGGSGGGQVEIPITVGETEVTAVVNATVDTLSEEGVAGWSLSIANNDCLNAVDATTAGSIADPDEPGSPFDPENGFNQTEVVDPTTVSNPGGSVDFSQIPADAEQGQGVVSGIVLSLADFVTLPPAGTFRFLSLRYELPAPLEEGETVECSFGFLDGLQGSGNPVKNSFGFDGEDKPPTSLIDFREGGQQGVAIFIGAPPQADEFVRGNANDDTKVDIADAIWLVGDFLGDPANQTACPESGDANDDGAKDLIDATFLIDYIFLGGDAPTVPFGPIPDECALDQDEDNLGCPPNSTTSCP